jgi:hypothetical protein
MTFGVPGIGVQPFWSLFVVNICTPTDIIDRRYAVEVGWSGASNDSPRVAILLHPEGVPTFGFVYQMDGNRSGTRFHLQLCIQNGIKDNNKHIMCIHQYRLDTIVRCILIYYRQANGILFFHDLHMSLS